MSNVGKRPLTHRLAVPPLPGGEGKTHRGARPRARKNAFSLSAGEWGDRKAVGEGSFGQGIGGSAGGYLLPTVRSPLARVNRHAAYSHA